MKRIAMLVAAAALSAAGVAAAADTTPTKPSATTAKATKPSARGPGTQTEDELYIGAKAKAPQATETKRGRPKKAAAPATEPTK